LSHGSSVDHIHVAAAVLEDKRRRVLLALRPKHTHQGGLWEFPGGKVENGESVRDALRRELLEELGIVVRNARPLIRVEHDYTDRVVILDVYKVEHWSGKPYGREGQTIEWVSIDALSGLALPAADVPIIAATRLSPLYLVTPDIGPRSQQQFLARLESCFDDGIRLFQLRSPDTGDARYKALVSSLLRLCDARGAQMLLNADPDRVVELGAHGVHLNSRRLLALENRPLDRDLWVAASCHNAHELAHAVEIKCDFAVLSPVCATPSHPNAEPLGWDRFREMAVTAKLPVYALGGTSRADLTRAWNHGAQGIAAVRALWCE
jgi:8-oxo-dGTP diphosphatase